MALLNKDEFFARIQARVGDDRSDEAVSFVEDMTDTYNDLERRANGDGIDWEQKYKENDAAWKAKYTNRFFHGDSGDMPPKETKREETTYNPDDITVESLFIKEGK